eukprot:gene10382-21657_t
MGCTSSSQSVVEQPLNTQPHNTFNGDSFNKTDTTREGSFSNNRISNTFNQLSISMTAINLAKQSKSSDNIEPGSPSAIKTRTPLNITPRDYPHPHSRSSITQSDRDSQVERSPKPRSGIGKAPLRFPSEGSISASSASATTYGHPSDHERSSVVSGGTATAPRPRKSTGTTPLRLAVPAEDKALSSAALRPQQRQPFSSTEGSKTAKAALQEVFCALREQGELDLPRTLSLCSNAQGAPVHLNPFAYLVGTRNFISQLALTVEDVEHAFELADPAGTGHLNLRRFLRFCVLLDSELEEREFALMAFTFMIGTRRSLKGPGLGAGPAADDPGLLLLSDVKQWEQVKDLVRSGIISDKMIESSFKTASATSSSSDPDSMNMNMSMDDNGGGGVSPVALTPIDFQGFRAMLDHLSAKFRRNNNNNNMSSQSQTHGHGQGSSRGTGTASSKPSHGKNSNHTAPSLRRKDKEKEKGRPSYGTYREGLAKYPNNTLTGPVTSPGRGRN